VAVQRKLLKSGWRTKAKIYKIRQVLPDQDNQAIYPHVSCKGEAIMNIAEAKARIKELDDGQWAEAMEAAGDYHHLSTLCKVQDCMDCPSWKVFALLDYMERVSAQIEREE